MFNPSRDRSGSSSSTRGASTATARRSRDWRPSPSRSSLLHPEYHPVLDDPERYRTGNTRPKAGETNPFLHMSMHLAIEEQLSIDQPAGHPRGVRAHRRRDAATGTRHCTR